MEIRNPIQDSGRISTAPPRESFNIDLNGAKKARVKLNEGQHDEVRPTNVNNRMFSVATISSAFSGYSNRFKSTYPLQFLLWAHYLSLGAATMCLCMGIFSYLWADAQTYKCKINGDLISPLYLYDDTGRCPSVFYANGQIKRICCDPNTKSSLQGYREIGIAYVLYSIFILLYENTEWGYGLWAPNDTYWFRHRVSPIGFLHFLAGLAGLYNYATCLAGGCLLVAGIVYQCAAYRMEAGDGGRTERRDQREKVKTKKDASTKHNLSPDTPKMSLSATCCYLLSYNPLTFYRRLQNEDKLWAYCWASTFIFANLGLFAYTVWSWYGVITTMQNDLLHGTLNIACDDLMCHVNRKAIRYGPVSAYAPWAKGFGVCLNFDCAVLLLPIVKMLLRRITSRFADRFANCQRQSPWFRWFFPLPITRYIPFQKNIELHILCTVFIFINTWGHMIAHWLNLYEANDVTLRLFRFLRWNGTDYFTGAVAFFALFLIYSASPEVLRLAKYEIFMYTHHVFVVFYLAMFLHGPNFFYWTCFPVVLYLYDRFLLLNRGNTPFTVLKVEYVPPVLSLYIRPTHRNTFTFKEGQYLFLNCPYLSPYQWHPFTISSAPEDLTHGPRVHIVTGEEVYEIPRPKDYPTHLRWKKYCLVSKDWEKVDPREYIEHSETDYLDYLTLHIRVHRLHGPVARSWTRKLKEYFELLSSTKNQFQHYFLTRNLHGDAEIGKQFGPDGVTPILRVDGPHYGPSEHYSHYRTVMLIGAGIGLTPCVSILSTLIKYRWKKSFEPEVLHFYWMVRYDEIDSFQWLVHMLTELSYELKRARQYGQISEQYACTMNIYITQYQKSKSTTQKSGALKAVVRQPDEPKRTKSTAPSEEAYAAAIAQRAEEESTKDENDEEDIGNVFYRPKKKYSPTMLEQCAPSFTVDDLYSLMLKPSVPSKDQVRMMKDASNSTNQSASSTSTNVASPNRLQDIWIWEGRPQWDAIFAHVKETRKHRDIGVCFCGAPAIATELIEKCEKYSRAADNCLFSLHRENF